MNIKKALSSYCTLHWWNMGSKTLSFKGELRDLLKNNNLSFTKRKTESPGYFIFHFKSAYGIKFVARGSASDLPHYAKQFIQMELVRMGDKSTLYVSNSFRSVVTVNH